MVALLMPLVPAFKAFEHDRCAGKGEQSKAARPDSG